jgi:DNA mismatch repair protein MutS
MSFIIDKQTLDDLNLVGKFRNNSVYGLFNKVKTPGGERLLEHLFQNPMTDAGMINSRSATFKYFQELDIDFPFQYESFRVVENYLGMDIPVSRLVATAGTLRKKVADLLLRDEQYNIIYKGLLATIETFRLLKQVFSQMKDHADSPYREKKQLFQRILMSDHLSWLEKEQHTSEFPVMKVAKYDYLLRHKLRTEMETVLEIVYELDVFIAVGKVSGNKGYHYAEALPTEQNLIQTAALWHPCIDNAVANKLVMTGDFNMLFLTGANMAGKSTLMKSVGIAVYLAHMGFPVAAEEFRFSVKEGMCTSINVPDSLDLGLSHFYAEVLRVKKVAEQVSQGKKLVVIFDELFKGTNVKDAYDATFAVSEAFSKYRGCFFIISTHIIEVGEALRQRCGNLQYNYLPTVMEGKIPKYTYLLKEGITSDRQGMMIIENEGIVELIRSQV